MHGVGRAELVRFHKSLAKSHHPKNKLYEILFEHSLDKLISYKLQFFIDITETFLTRFQTYKPMLPFMDASLHHSICSCPTSTV